MSEWKSVIVEAPVDGIKPNPFQVRELDEETVADLEIVIREHGFRGVLVGRALRNGEVMVAIGDGSHLQGDVVERFVEVQIAWGHHRLEAARLAGLKFVSVEVVAALSDEEMASWALMENVRRRDMSALEEAKAIRQLVDGFRWSQQKVAEALGYKSAATISNKLRLLRLPKEILDKVQAGELAERTARMLIPLADVSEKKAMELASDGHVSDARVKQSLRGATKELWGGWEEAPWPSDHVFGLLGEGAVTCAECQEHIRVGETEVRCTKVSCWHKRRRAWEAEQVVESSEKMGVPALKDGEKAVKFEWERRDWPEGRCKQRDGGLCPWLRLDYVRGSSDAVLAVCGNPEEFEKCKGQEKTDKEQRKAAEKKRGEHCNKEIRKAAVRLARRMTMYKWMVPVLNRVLTNGTMWQAVPEDLVEEEDSLHALAFRLIVELIDLPPWQAPTAANCKREVARVLAMAGLEDESDVSVEDEGGENEDPGSDGCDQ